MYRLRMIVLLLIFCPIVMLANSTQQYKLENGLTLIVAEDHRAPIVVSQVWYKVGGLNEPLGITGISHMLEHMMFKGTKKYPVGEFSRLITKNGGRLNAGTNRDYTFYYEVIGKDKLAMLFDLESDRMRSLDLQAKEFEKEHQVVIEERRLRTDDKPHALTRERFTAAAYVASPYHNPVVGWPYDVRHLTLKDLKQWYQQWYVPNNATIVVVGDVQPQKVLALVRQYFDGIPKREVQQTVRAQDVEGFGKKQIQVRIPAKLPSINMGYQVPSLVTAKDKKEAYALEVLAAILSEGSSSRLQADLVRGTQVATQVYAYYDLYARLNNLLQFFGVPSQGHRQEQLVEAVEQEVSWLRKHLVPVDELKRAKTQLIAAKAFAKDSIEYQAMQIGNVVTVGLPWQVTQEYSKQVEAVTAKQIRAVAKKYLKSDRLTIATLVPKSEKL